MVEDLGKVMEFNWGSPHKYDLICNSLEDGQIEEAKTKSPCSTNAMTCFDLVDNQEFLEYQEIQSLIIPTQSHFSHQDISLRLHQQQQVDEKIEGQIETMKT